MPNTKQHLLPLAFALHPTFPRQHAASRQLRPANNMISPVQAPSQAHGIGLRRLPTELRYQIYRPVWEPRVIFLGDKTCYEFPDNLPGRSRCDTQRPPVTFHISYEAGEETLRHYHKYFIIAHDPSRRLKLYGYVNPHLDILHFDQSITPEHWSSYLFQDLELPLNFRIEPPITRPILRLSLSPSVPARDKKKKPTNMLRSGNSLTLGR